MFCTFAVDWFCWVEWMCSHITIFLNMGLNACLAITNVNVLPSQKEWIIFIKISPKEACHLGCKKNNLVQMNLVHRLRVDHPEDLKNYKEDFSDAFLASLYNIYLRSPHHVKGTTTNLRPTDVTFLRRIDSLGAKRQTRCDRYLFSTDTVQAITSISPPNAYIFHTDITEKLQIWRQYLFVYV